MTDTSTDPGLLDSNPVAMAAVTSTEITKWSDEKRKDFVGTFKNRVQAARFILELSWERVLDKAKNRKFISDKHVKMFCRSVGMSFHDLESGGRRRYNMTAGPLVGDRRREDLAAVAEERAEAVLAELPPLKDAVKLIDPDTAKKIVRRDELLKKGNELSEKLEEISVPIKMSEVPQTMTIKEFRALVKDHAKKREDLIKALNTIGEEGQELEDQINKALYAGLPGLSDAVIEVVKKHRERALALDEFARRVEEKILFGDSEAAMELLKHFENDEVQVNDELKTTFRAALEKLGVAKKLKGRAAKAGK